MDRHSLVITETEATEQTIVFHGRIKADHGEVPTTQQIIYVSERRIAACQIAAVEVEVAFTESFSGVFCNELENLCNGAPSRAINDIPRPHMGCGNLRRQ